MLVQTFLGRLVVIRHDRQAGSSPYLGSITRQLDRLRGRIGARTGDDWNTAGDNLNRETDQFAMLIDIDRRRFARRANDYDAIGTFLDVVLDQLVETVVVRLPSSCIGVTMAGIEPVIMFMAEYKKKTFRF
jgi:hypothetical protein